MLFSFTYQFQKNPIWEPRQEKSQNVIFESKITERTNFFNNKSKKIVKESLFTMPPLDNKIFISGDFGAKLFARFFQF